MIKQTFAERKICEGSLSGEADVKAIMKKEDCEKINGSFDNVEIKAEFSGKNMDSIWNF